MAILPMLAAVALAVLGGYLSYRLGCVFDSKQGYGSYAVAQMYGYRSLACDAAALLFFALASAMLAGNDPANRATAVLFTLLLMAPTLWYCGISLETHGTMVCRPV